MPKIPKKNRWALMKIANIDRVDRESLHIFSTTTEISMKFSNKMWLVMISKVKKIQGFTIPLEDAFLENSQMGINLTPKLF